jgi:hypothetical protein
MARPLTRRLGLLLLLLGTIACKKSAAPVVGGAAAVQAAAVAFLARANADQAPCVHTAVGPDELSQGRVAKRLDDPPLQLVTILKEQGVTVRPFSTCSLADREKVTYAVGWPRSSARGCEVNADRLCGARCGEGSLVLVKPVGMGWRATEAETTWTM